MTAEYILRNKTSYANYVGPTRCDISVEACIEIMHEYAEIQLRKAADLCHVASTKKEILDLINQLK